MITGFKFSGAYETRARAEEKIEELYADGIISESDNPRAEPEGGSRWYVVINERY